MTDDSILAERLKLMRGQLHSAYRLLDLCGETVRLGRDQLEELSDELIALLEDLPQ